jgi:hypothetical protein
LDAQTRTLDVVERVLAEKPRVVGFGVYIWNVAPLTDVVRALKRVAPDVVVVLGGPEVSHETDGQAIVEASDYVIRGEGDLAFADLCARVLAGERPAGRILDAPLPDLAQIALPYDEYDATDVAHRVVYVEASRGCPFTCEFCLSSLDERVRPFPLDAFLGAMQRLLDRGVRHFKFVDRTFNLGLAASLRILEFFRERAQFPPGALQFEVGIQTFDDAVAARISRKQDNEKAAGNLRFLRDHTGVHVHADLIAGLPGEDLVTFARGFDRLLALDPHEIQVGILKRLRGVPIGRHDQEWRIVYGAEPPYEVLSTSCLDFATLQRLRRFARYFDLVRNSGNFVHGAKLLWREGSAFARFLAFSDWLFAQTGTQHGIALHRLAELLFVYLTKVLAVPTEVAGRALWQDFQRTRPNDWPAFLRPFASEEAAAGARAPAAAGGKRQARHAPDTSHPGAR